MNANPFTDNIVILTGASSGIGRQLAFRLVDEGARLTLAARSIEGLKETAKICEQKGGEVLVIPTDISEQSQCQHLVERTIKEYGRIDTLINNAGISMHARFDEIQDINMIEKIMRVNFLGSVYCTYYALPHLKRSIGRLVGISSFGGKFPSPYASGYGASKHAMAGFFDSLRVELKDTGVSVTMIYVSWVATGISSRALGADGKRLGKTRRHEEGAMPVETCVDLILEAAAKRKREYLPLRGKLGMWFKLFSPGVVDREAIKTLGE